MNRPRPPALAGWHRVVETRLVHGVDILRWGPDDRLTSFTVIVRPAQGLQTLIAHMARALDEGR